nr:hypothetical protein [uncultured Celeribacter sp.]
MAKQVILQGGRVFPTLSSAKAHYSEIRKASILDDLLVEPERSEILEIYLRYCEVTNYPAVSAQDVTVKNDNRPRSNDNYSTTKAFFIVDAAGERHVFSIDKALAAIAT